MHMLADAIHELPGVILCPRCGLQLRAERVSVPISPSTPPTVTYSCPDTLGSNPTCDAPSYLITPL